MNWINGLIQRSGLIQSCSKQIHTYSRKVLDELKLDAYPFYVERAWWKDGNRMTFWADWRMKKDVKNRKLLHSVGPDRVRYKAMKSNNILPQAMRDEFQEKMNNMPRFSHPQRIFNMCMFTGRKRGKIKRFRVNRHIFRRLADHGELCGVERAMW